MARGQIGPAAPGGGYAAVVTQNVRFGLSVQGEGVIVSDDFEKSYHPQRLAWQAFSCPGALADSAQPLVDSNLVTLEAIACPGYEFSHWEYDNGSGWQSTTGNGGLFNPKALKVHMNWWQGSGIRLQDGEIEMKVRAVFDKEICPCGPGCDEEDHSHLTAEDIAVLANFPNLLLCNVTKTGPASITQNCYGFVLGVEEVITEEEIHWAGASVVTVSDVVTYFAMRGVTEGYILYGTSVNDVAHAAKYSGGQCAESKLGLNIRIRHDPNELEGGEYGQIVYP